jgi:hypothetical protein
VSPLNASENQGADCREKDDAHDKIAAAMTAAPAIESAATTNAIPTNSDFCPGCRLSDRIAANLNQWSAGAGGHVTASYMAHRNTGAKVSKKREAPQMLQLNDVTKAKPELTFKEENCGE